MIIPLTKQMILATNTGSIVTNHVFNVFLLIELTKLIKHWTIKNKSPAHKIEYIGAEIIEESLVFITLINNGNVYIKDEDLFEVFIVVPILYKK